MGVECIFKYIALTCGDGATPCLILEGTQLVDIIKVKA